MADSIFDALDAALTEGRPVVLATVVAGPHIGAKMLVTAGESARSVAGRMASGWGDDDLDATVERDAEAALASGISTVRHYGDGERLGDAPHQVFFDAHVPPPRLIICGAVDFTAALVRAAKTLGFHVAVCDTRATFATPARFPDADDIVVDWPHRHLGEIGSDLGPRDAVCILTHDAKFDVPAVIAALDTPVGYIGALGSRRTTDDRVDRLRAEGVTDDNLIRIMAPIGLDLGARTPAETAIAICAEIIAVQTGRAVPSLRDTSGPIHARPSNDTGQEGG